jgi:hypothetical protein
MSLKKLEITIKNNDMYVKVNKSNSILKLKHYKNEYLLEFLGNEKLLNLEKISLPLIDGSIEKLSKLKNLKKIYATYSYSNPNNLIDDLINYNISKISILVLDLNITISLLNSLLKYNLEFKYNSNTKVFSIKKNSQNGGIGFIIPAIKKNIQNAKK